MTAPDDGGSISSGTLRKLFDSEGSSQSDGSNHVKETAGSALPRAEVTSSERHHYSIDALRALRHERRSAVPENITKSANVPQPKIVTLKPNPPTPFATFSFPKDLSDALTSLSLTTATPIQATAIPYARLGGDLVAQATSGTGKTLTYALVALDSILPATSAKAALIIVPARELATQVAEVFTKLSAVRVVTLVGGTKESLDEERLSRPANVIVGTPGRVETMVTRGSLDVASIKILVLDEADRLLDGSFGGSVERICKMLPTRQTLAFSATFSYSFRMSLLEVMREPAWIGGSQVVHSVVQRKVNCFDLTDKVDALKNFLQLMSFNLCVVFFNAKKAAARMVRSLTRSSSFQTKLIHAGMTQKERDSVIRDVRQGKVRVLVTTDVLARGIDFDSCDFVVQMDVPLRVETYLHRVGRAGRFGRKGSSLLMFDEGEVSAVLALEGDLGYEIGTMIVLDEGRFKPSTDTTNSMQSLQRKGASAVSHGEEHNAERKGYDPENVIIGKENEAPPKESIIPPGRSTTPEAKAEAGDPGLNIACEDVEAPAEASQDTRRGGPKPAVPAISPFNFEEVIPQNNPKQIDTPINRMTLTKPDETVQPGEKSSKEHPPSKSAPAKRPRFPDDPATPAKKRKSARLVAERLPAYETNPSGGKNVLDCNQYRRDAPRSNSSTAMKRQRMRLDLQIPSLQGNDDVRSPDKEEYVRFENNGGNMELVDDGTACVGEKGAGLERDPAQPRNRTSDLAEPGRLSSTVADKDIFPRGGDQANGIKKGGTVIASLAQTEASPEGIPYERHQNDDNWMSTEHTREAPPEEQTESVPQQCREAWDSYAEAAYDTGYREAYEEAFRIARGLRQRLEGRIG